MIWVAFFSQRAKTLQKKTKRGSNFFAENSSCLLAQVAKMKPVRKLKSFQPIKKTHQKRSENNTDNHKIRIRQLPGPAQAGIHPLSKPLSLLEFQKQRQQNGPRLHKLQALPVAEFEFCGRACGRSSLPTTPLGALPPHPIPSHPASPPLAVYYICMYSNNSSPGAKRMENGGAQRPKGCAAMLPLSM